MLLWASPKTSFKLWFLILVMVNSGNCWFVPKLWQGSGCIRDIDKRCTSLTMSLFQYLTWLSIQDCYIRICSSRYYSGVFLFQPNARKEDLFGRPSQGLYSSSANSGKCLMEVTVDRNCLEV